MREKERKKRARKEYSIQYHIMRFVVDPKDHIWVADEATSKLSPEFLELFGCGCVGIGGVANNLSYMTGIGTKYSDLEKVRDNLTYTPAIWLVGWITRTQ